MKACHGLRADEGNFSRRTTARRRLRGIAAVEFAIVFPLFFVVFYGIVTYGLIFTIQQSLTLAVQEGARAALADSVDPVTAACAAANNATAWLQANLVCGQAAVAPKVVPCPYPATGTPPVPTTLRCMQVLATYPYKSKPLIPTLPIVGPLIALAVPDTLSATAWVQLQPEYSVN